MIFKELKHLQKKKTTYLAHEAGDDAMKCGALVAEALLSGAQCTEVFCRNNYFVMEALRLRNSWDLKPS